MSDSMLAVVIADKGFAVLSGAVEPSHVVSAIGISRKDARSCVRFSLGRGNTEAQVDALIDAVDAVVSRLRRLSTDYAAHV